MNFSKKSLGQNFLIEKNIIKKILNLIDLKNKHILEIGPGKGALTDEIILKKPKTLTLIEKDNNLINSLRLKYSGIKRIKFINKDILKFNYKSLAKKKIIVIGNLPYNISSQILVKILKEEKVEERFSDLILMFQKELGEKIIAKFPSEHYGRLSILTKFNLDVINKFLISANCFKPKPKVTSMIIHFRTKINNNFNIKKITSLEKITNILFSNRRKMINKNLTKILDHKRIKQISNLKLHLRAEKLSPEIIYKITELYEKGR